VANGRDLLSLKAGNGRRTTDDGQRMKLLFLAHRIPYPPNKGDKIRSFHEVSALVARGHEVHLLAFADDPRDLRHQTALAQLCASATIVPLHRGRAKLRALSYLLADAPLSLGYFGSARLHREVRRQLAARRYDAVFVYSSTMAQYVPDELAARTVVDLVDVDSEKWRDYTRIAPPPLSWLYELEAHRLLRYEHAIVARFAHTIVTTEREAALLKSLDEFTRRARLRAITNGVDLERYRPDALADCTLDCLPAGERQFLAKAEGPRLVFTGAMDYYANVEGARYFAEEVFPLIRERAPRAEFLIVGSNPTAAVKRLGRRPGVTVTGFVKDVRPYLAAATACVAPLRLARGVQNKILEAMASGRAVITLPEAAAGLRAVDGEHLLVARSTRELVEASLKVMQDEQVRTRLGAQARRFVEEEHAWPPLLERLVDLVESVATRAASASGWRQPEAAFVLKPDEAGMREGEKPRRGAPPARPVRSRTGD
jgi:sugar transferase (PEP-CTERM/EpsH1 system associated)